FILRAVIVNWSGDTPGLTKLMGLTGHNSYKGCRYCNLKGVHTNHIYYPTTPPTNINSKKYFPSNLPSRTHEEWKERLKKIHKTKFEKERSKLITKYGITKRSILFDLSTTHFPDSFTIDIMHLFYENIAKYMFKHWTGTFFSDESLNREPYVLARSVWLDIGKQMHALRKDLPSNLRSPLRNIMQHHRRYKAEEWAAWITMYSLPLLKGRLPSIYYNGWSLFVKAVQLCQKKIITADDLDNINDLILKFYNHYEQ
ncbi:hypothetical protein C2G38_1991615, partial [Gigaspora rosea]